MLIPFSPMHAFYYLSPILLTHSLFLGVVLSSLVTPPRLHTRSSSFSYVFYFAVLSWATTLCPRKSFSFTRSSCTFVTLICSPQLHYWQLLLMTDVSQSAASLLLAPSLREAPDFFKVCSLKQHFYTDAAKSPFTEVQLLREFQVLLHHQGWIPIETAWEKLQTMLSSGVSKHGWHFALGVLFWAVTACQCIISLPNIHSRSSGLECADKPSSYQP